MEWNGNQRRTTKLCNFTNSNNLQLKWGFQHSPHNEN